MSELPGIVLFSGAQHQIWSSCRPRGSPSPSNWIQIRHYWKDLRRIWQVERRSTWSEQRERGIYKTAVIRTCRTRRTTCVSALWLPAHPHIPLIVAPLSLSIDTVVRHGERARVTAVSSELRLQSFRRNPPAVLYRSTYLVEGQDGRTSAGRSTHDMANKVISMILARHTHMLCAFSVPPLRNPSLRPNVHWDPRKLPQVILGYGLVDEISLFVDFIDDDRHLLLFSTAISCAYPLVFVAK